MHRPNIVFVFSDQQHWQALGHLDPSFKTPALDSLYDQSTVFTHAYCTCPQCSPSRSSMLTGFYPHTTMVQGNVGAAGGEALQMATIAKPLQAAGYRTAYFGKWHLGNEPIATAGWDEDFGVTGPETTDDDTVSRHAIDFLRARGSETGGPPFALFLSYNNPHDIYRFSQGLRVSSATTRLHPDHDNLSSKPAIQREFMVRDQGRVMAAAGPEEWRAYRALYREMTQRYDAHVGELVATMRRLSLLNRTVLVVTSDHGDMDGAHGLIYKGPFMYEQVTRVPLMIRLPAMLGGPAHRPIDHLVTNTDLFATLIDIAGADLPATHGNSLLPYVVDNRSSVRDFVVGQYYGKQRWVNPIRMLRTQRWKLNRYAGGELELYDLHTDPGELSNLAGRPDRSEVIRSLNNILAEWIVAHDDPFPKQSPTTRDGEPSA